MKKNIWRQCRSKFRYRNEHDANRACIKYENERGKKLDCYYCVYCNGWHLTSSTESMLGKQMGIYES